MNEIKRITRIELARMLGVSYNTYRSLAAQTSCSFALGYNPNLNSRHGRMPMLTITQVAEAVVKLYDFFENPIPDRVLHQAQHILQQKNTPTQ